MMISIGRTGFVLFCIMISFAVITLIASPLVVHVSFADGIYRISKGTTLALGCNVSNDKDFITTTKVFRYDQPNKLTFNCQRSGGDVDLKKGESIAVQCLHDNPLTTTTDVKMKAGELFYVICNKK
jgi:hypothetical protein